MILRLGGCRNLTWHEYEHTLADPVAITSRRKVLDGVKVVVDLVLDWL
jgi:hypothetical protein